MGNLGATAESCLLRTKQLVCALVRDTENHSNFTHGKFCFGELASEFLRLSGGLSFKLLGSSFFGLNLCNAVGDFQVIHSLDRHF